MLCEPSGLGHTLASVPAFPPVASAPGSKIKILVADDSQSDRTVARAVLQSVGYEIVEATDGQQALDVFERERPAVVVIDVVMPRLGGLETCRLLKSRTNRYLPVLMVSSRNSVQDRVNGLRAGADDFIGKPYDPEELRARIEVLVRTQAAFEGQAASAPSRGRGRRERDRKPDSGGFELGDRAHTPMSPEAFKRRMAVMFEESERNSDPLACLLVDLDRPPWGKDPVDLALRAEVIHGVIKSCIRKIDLVNPWNENGYILLLPNTHFPGALTVAERIARQVRRQSREGGGRRGFTVSIGISFYPNRDTRSLKDMLDLVDAALERAQHEGGGKICLFQHQGYLYAPDDDG